MGGAIGNAISSVSNFVSNNVIEPITHEATSLLSSAVSGFEGILKNPMSALTNPMSMFGMGGLASGMLGGLAGPFAQLFKMGQPPNLDQIQQALQQLQGQAQQLAGGAPGQMITTPGIANRDVAAEIQQLMQQIQTLVNGGQLPSSTSAATGGGSTTSAATGTGATGGGRSLDAQVEDGSIFAGVPPEPTINAGDDDKTIAIKNQQIQKHNNMMNMIGQMMAAINETKKALIALWSR